MTGWMRALLAVLLIAGGSRAIAQANPDIGDVTMDAKKTLTDNIGLSPIHEALEDALASTGVAVTLSGHGPYTVFAPTDDAFNLQHSTSRTTPPAPTEGILRYHVVAGKLSSGKLRKLLKKGKGTATLTTLEGESLKLGRHDNILYLTDSKGGVSVITTPDIRSKNGILHVVDAVLLPKS